MKAGERGMVQPAPMTVAATDRPVPRDARVRAQRCFDHSPFPIPHSRTPGFSLIELLVALAVFAALAAAAYGGLGAIARTRGVLAVQQDRFAAIARTVASLERDLRQAVARPVIGNEGAMQPALVGSAGAIELSRLGYANPLAESRSNVERVVYTDERGTVRRGRYLVLDRAPNSLPLQRDLLARAGELRFRYYGCDGAWRDAWPPREPLACQADAQAQGQLPRAVEFRFAPEGLGEIRRIVELPSPWPARAVAAPGDGDAPPPGRGGREQAASRGGA
ncbi:general secretion pathway protein J [Dokdonella fugitiva]|uniref:Type II secretion system protein J n=2 Tax=Dokdonella fugitiva TaxID=328517 RepID=A0A4R2I5X6_9GAMM|nr:general secretion pathway protein J [Dokdonella fugitiva]